MRAEDPVLALRELSIGFGERTILDRISFEVGRRGTTLVLGPAGVGKSTLVRTLARRAELLPSFWARGQVSWGRRDLLTEVPAEEARRRIALLAQKARLYTASVQENLLAALSPEMVLSGSAKRDLALAVLERAGLSEALGRCLSDPVIALPLGLQRRLSIARVCALEPVVLLVDEPTRDLKDDEALELEAMLRAEAERRAVLLITHDQQFARRIGQQVVLLAAGRVVAAGDARSFFTSPPSEIARRFVSQGNCWTEESQAPGAASPIPPLPEPSGFRWVIPGRLGGMARPGLLGEEEEDLEGLVRLGVHTLVTLEEAPVAREGLARHGIAAEHLPIPDMGVPSLEAAVAVCRRAAARAEQGQATVFHCKGGLGRTGCLLATYLILGGMPALHAIEELRGICTAYIQSDAQLAFLDQVQGWREETGQDLGEARPDEPG